MKRLLLLISLAMTIILSGCSSSVPDCGDAKTTSMVNDLVLQSLLGDEAKNSSDMFKVEISAVQTVMHTKDPEKYSCKANVKITTIGKMDELFGHTNEQVALIQNNKMPVSETVKLGYYSEFAQYLDNKFGNKSGALVDDAARDMGRMLAIANFFKPGIDFFYSSDAESMRAKVAGVMMLSTPQAIERSTRAKSIEFISTSAQQNGSAHHYVEIQKLSARPDILLIEMTKFAKAYVPTAPAKSVPASAVSATKLDPTQSDLPRIFPSKDCAKATSDAAKLICSNPDLIALDEELSKIYLAALASHPDRADTIRKEQMDWTEPRDSCTEVDCLLAMYNVQKELLK